MTPSESFPAGYLAALEAVSAGNVFDAHFHLQSVDRSVRPEWRPGDALVDELDAAVRKLCLQTPPPITLLIDLLSLAPGGYCRVSSDTEDLVVKTLMLHDLDEEGAGAMARLANHCIADYTRLKLAPRLSLVASLCFSFANPPSNGPGVDLEHFGAYLANNIQTDFLSNLAWLLMPVVVLAEEGKLDAEGISRIEQKVTRPLYSICCRLAANRGMISSGEFFENLAWFVTTRLEDLPSICTDISFFNPQKVAMLVAYAWERPVKSYQNQLKGVRSEDKGIRLRSCAVTVDYVSTHLDLAQVSRSATHLFAGLLAQYGHLLQYGRSSSYELLIEVLNSLFSVVDLELCQELLKRHNGVYLSLYLRDFNPKSLNDLSESNITELLEHDLGF
ncbi:hypothetical protein [Pseudomonas sp. S1(2024)]|uniref:hypothetical protein n=1 Tax=Pseudomonas sp. S1(2024) TaxID=3390191 RepID=UPI00397BF3D6